MSKDPMGNAAWFEVKRGWKTYVALGLILIVVLAFLNAQDAFLRADGESTDATIVTFGTPPLDQKYFPGTITVVAKTRDGRFGTRIVSRNRLADCEIGDRIAATKVGASLRLEPSPCK